MIELTSKQLERFYHYRHDDEFSGCVEWSGPLDKDGYGVFNANRKAYKAHRVAWQLHTGWAPDGYCVCHECDNPKCVNPYHLFIGTQLENIQDRHDKGRSRNKPTPGMTHNMVKLSDDDVLAIRSSDMSGITLSKQYGVSQSTISVIRSRKRWKHL